MRRLKARVDARELRRQKAVARHREEDARLSELEDQKHGGVRDDRAEGDDSRGPRRACGRDAVERHRQRLGLLGRQFRHKLAVRDQPREDRADDDVEYGADDERRDDADGQVARRVLALFGHRADGVESDIGEEDEGRAGERAVPAVRLERVPVRGHLLRRDVVERDADEEQKHRDLDQNHPGVELRRLLDAPDEDDGDERDDAQGKQVEDDRVAEEVRRSAELFGEARGVRGAQAQGRAVVGREPGGDVHAEVAHQRAEVVGPTDGDGDVADGVLDD